MDIIQDKYLVLPMHTKMTISDAKRVSQEINKILKKIN
jgi:dTDP-4-amino-4,6-dideoxygalactose transaminase